MPATRENILGSSSMKFVLPSVPYIYSFTLLF